MKNGGGLYYELFDMNGDDGRSGETDITVLLANF